MSSEVRQDGGEPGISNAPPHTLQAGRHKLAPEWVRAHQQTRVIEAIAALCAERGYANVVISDIVARAAVSKSTLYGLYDTKDACLFDAHKHYSACLLAEIDTATRALTAPREALAAAIRAALNFCAADLAAAQLLTTGILSAGPEGSARYQTTIAAIAKRLHPAAKPPRPHFTALAAAILAAPVISASLEVGGPNALPVLESELLELALSYTEPS